MGTKHGKNQKGCPLCKPWKDHRVGRAQREPAAVLRKLGKTKRITRNELPT